MRSLRSLEGYLLIDNRCSGEGMQEHAVLTCSHCHRQIIVNPLRTRERNHCRKCHAYVCDNPGCNAECNGGLGNVFDEARNKIVKKFII
jgi:hypothetical protein